MTRSKTIAVQAVLFVIQQDSRISLTDIASHIGISKRNLINHIAKAMKISLTDFKRAYRMQLAAKIIQYSPQNTTITEICRELKFQHTTTFSKYFKKELGISPRAYQLQYGNTKKLPENTNLSDELIKHLCKKYFRH